MAIYSPAGMGKNVKPRSYLNEIKQVSDEGLEFHIANRHDDITKLLRQVAYSEKPNFAIIGPPGTGKTMTVNYFVDVLTGKTNLPKDHEWYLLFEAIKTKAREFQTRDYIFLPNLSDPYRPTVLDFAKGEIKQVNDTAKAFCDDMVRAFENIGLEEKIFPHFEQGEFRYYLKTAVKHVYEALYRVLNIATEAPVSIDLSITPDFTGYGIRHTFLDKVSWDSIKSNIGMSDTKRRKGKDGIMRRTHRKITEHQVRERLYRDLKKEARGNIIQLLSIVDNAEVTGLNPKQKQQVLYDALKEAKQEYDEASEIYTKGRKLAPHYHALAKLKARVLPTLKLSQKSLDWCNENLEAIFEQHKDTDPKLQSWMSSVVRYFKENTETVSSAIIDQYLEARGDRIIKGEGKPMHVVLSHPFADVDDIEFKIPHGDKELGLRKILNPKKFISRAGEICVKFPTSFNKEDMWGRIGKPDNDDDNADDIYDDIDKDAPPHRKFTPGYLMESSMIVLVDNMQGFFKALLGSEVQDAAARRQSILTFVEDGNLMIEDSGITFVVHSPTMIVGCDNENPFVKFHGTYADEYEFDESMYTRFTVYDWDELTQNIPGARKETIGVINSATKDFNKKFKLEKGVRLSSEVINQLLLDWSWPDLLNLDYRTLRHRVFELLGFARMKSKEACTLEHMIENEKENEPKWIHHFIDNEIYEMIENPPEKTVGEVHGVSLYGHHYHPRYMPGDISIIRSAVIVDTPSGVGRNFQQYNIDARLTDKTAIKGFNEAVDFVKRQINVPVRFISKTTFHKEFQSSGDSASLPMAVAISSALSETPIYSNTVYTGNLSFFDGTVGPIGGIYNKARTVWRASQMLNKNKKMKFVFPVENFRELKEILRTSSYPIEKGIDLIPANNFAEAFYLGSTNTEIDIKTLPEKANSLWEKTLKKIRTNVKCWNNQVLIAYGRKPIK